MIRKCLSECEDGNGDDKINDSENEDESYEEGDSDDERSVTVAVTVMNKMTVFVN